MARKRKLIALDSKILIGSQLNSSTPLQMKLMTAPIGSLIRFSRNWVTDLSWLVREL